MKSDIKLQVSVNIHAPLARVWQALTDPALVEKYFFGTHLHTDWKPGSPIVFEGEWQGKTYRDKGTVKELRQGKLIRYDYWSSMSGMEDKPENYVPISYELSGRDNEVLLTVTQENIPDEKMKEHSAENWGKVLNGLKDLVEKETQSA